MKSLNYKFRVIFIVLVFLSPFILATWVYRHANLFEFKTTNLGHLFSTPTQITGGWSAQEGQWQVLYWPRDAGSDASALLYQLHQMRIALGRSEKQLPIHVVLPESCDKGVLCQQKEIISQNGIDILDSHSNDFMRQLSSSDQANLQQNAEGKVYLIDPRGYFFMYYTENENPLNILQDLKHLWEVSSNG